ncbi:sigma-E processing peptidase SpoIIGA [Bacillus mangrovi]|uniref:Sporulation sigma-E factor-processing peptidase n=1 Tax=Metabacillus mangrovi TaxID=1491830 RepID=A0A7X2S3M7_9BACI|nr:sigma-E processing peptidase SpoIIGA [Metabacillus mangrovi]MTH52646.1 sigma-E processing peptidase SpoIIGA [Metabacillus mangrovi]
MTVYLDVIWLLNFLFDTMLLLLTAAMMKRKKVWYRILLGGFIGSALVLFLFTPLSPFFSHPAGKFLISILMVWTAFGFIRFKYFLQNLLMFYFATFAIGGGIIGVHYFLQQDSYLAGGVLITQSTGFGDPVSWLFAAAGFPLLWLFSSGRGKDIQVKKLQYEEIVYVTAYLGETVLEMRGLVDSGNQLYDPLTKTPVMIADTEKMKDHLPKALCDKVSSGKILEDTPDLDHEWQLRMRIVPYRGVGQQNQFMLALKPDALTISTGKEEWQVKKALIALSSSQLSADGDFTCIVHPQMLQHSSSASNVS